MSAISTLESHSEPQLSKVVITNVFLWSPKSYGLTVRGMSPHETHSSAWVRCQSNLCVWRHWFGHSALTRTTHDSEGFSTRQTQQRQRRKTTWPLSLGVGSSIGLWRVWTAYCTIKQHTRVECLQRLLPPPLRTWVGLTCSKTNHFDQTKWTIIILKP